MAAIEPKPWRLYRYKTVNEYLWQELELAEFYCGPPAGLNDPFDCRLNWEAALYRAQCAAISDERRKRLDAMSEAFKANDPLENAGVCCFTVNPQNHLMWAHYANSHQGVALRYEIPADYFHQRYPQKRRDEFFFMGGIGVSYGDDVFYQWLLRDDHNTPLPNSPVDNAASRIFSSKAQTWDHEEEFRVVTSVPGALEFDPAFLKGVLFGLGTIERHRRVVTKAAKRANPNVVISEATRHPLSDFGFDFREVKP